MLKSLFFVGLLWLSYVLARLDSLYQVENLSRPPAPWCSSRAASPSHRFQLSISGHKSRSIEEAIYSISTPGNERYARHLTQVEGQALLSADTEQRDVILSWLTASNVSTSDIKEDGHWIRFNATVEQANSMLAADFTWFRNLKTGGESLRTLRYSIPQKFRHTISLVHPTTRFGPGEAVQRSSQHQELRRRGLMQPRRVVESFARKDNHIINRATLDPSCNITITPSCIRSLYNIPTNITTSNARGVGVYASQSQVAKFTDFSIFTQNFIPEAAGANFTFLSINNDTTSQDDLIDSDVETNFDIQYAAGLSFPIPALIFSIGGQGPLVPELGNLPGDGSEPYLQWLDSILALPDDQLPHTITTSFGEDEQSLPDGYIQQVCNQFGALGARGVSFIAASGDSGPGAACVTNDGRNATRFTPIFPGTCPYVTAVGGVQGVAPERASVFSAAGFRIVLRDLRIRMLLSRSSWVGWGDKFDGLFNQSGRAFPDVASQAFNLTFVERGVVGGFAGTSGVSPTWAGFIGQINGALIAQNKSPLGFFNPWLYTTGLSAMTDIVDGGSKGCNGLNPFNNQPLSGGRIVDGAGWNATSGWDLVKGLGTPDVGKMLEMAMADGGGSGNVTAR